MDDDRYLRWFKRERARTRASITKIRRAVTALDAPGNGPLAHLTAKDGAALLDHAQEAERVMTEIIDRLEAGATIADVEADELLMKRIQQGSDGGR